MGKLPVRNQGQTVTLRHTGLEPRADQQKTEDSGHQQNSDFNHRIPNIN